MSGIVVTQVARAAPEVIAGLGRHGVATVHEAQARTGLLDPEVRPVWAGAHVVGSAVTVSLPPGDNWMVHVAVEQCQPGDVLVIAPTSSSTVAYVGDLLATALQARGAAGVVVDGGCRDVAALQAMGFPVWARWISASGAVKETLGEVNRPLVCAGQLVAPGDVVVADDDGVAVIPRHTAPDVLTRARRRDEREVATRERYRAGELSLDVHAMRERLAAKGLTYVTQPEQGSVPDPR